MRETKSPVKQQATSDPSFFRSSHNSMRQSVRMKPKASKTDAENIEQHYILHMIQLYNKNTNLYPNPTELLSNLKAKEKVLVEIENQLKYLQGKKSQKSLKQQKSTVNYMTGFSHINFEESIRKIVDSKFLKFKLMFIPLFQKYISGTSQFKQLQDAQNQKIPQAMLTCINFVINTFQVQAKTVEDKWYEKFTKKIQNLEERNIRQEKQNSLLIQKLNQNIKILEEEVKTERKIKQTIEKEKKQMQIKIFSQIQTSTQNQELLGVIEQQKKRTEHSEKRISELLKNLDDQQNLVKEYIRYIGKLQQTNKSIKSQIQIKQNQLRDLKKNGEEQEKKLPKIKSHSNFPSLKMLDQHQNSQVSSLKQQIKELKKTEIKLLKTLRQRQEKENKLLQKVIKDWKNQCQKIILQNERQIAIRDELIVSLQNQINQQQKQITLLKDLLKIQQPDMGSLL